MTSNQNTENRNPLYERGDQEPAGDSLNLDDLIAAFGAAAASGGDFLSDKSKKSIHINS